MKKAVVLPIYKGGDRSVVGNYWPVSLISVVYENRGNLNGFEGSCMGKGISLRTFAERVDMQLSEEVRVTSGVPQGSV